MNHFTCQTCHNSFSLRESRWRCDCGGLLDIVCDFNLNRDSLKNRKPTLWRYRETIPIENDGNIVSWNEGFTPLVPFEIDQRPLWIKLDYLFPTGSYKDRGACVLISKAKELGIRKLVEDSSGNAGCAIAAYAARAGIECDIYVPEKTSLAKTAQIQMYGARLNKIPGNREDTAQAARQAAESAYYASHVWNPWFHQGTKTLAYEIWEQLDFHAPDALILPTSNGSLLIGVYDGFQDLLKKQWIAKIPRLIAVQAENCAPLFRMFCENLTAVPPIASCETIAEGIAIAAPARGVQIVDLIRKTAGEVITVSEAAIQQAYIDLGRCGIYVEPTAAAALAGFRLYQSKPNERVVVTLTGHGLKSKLSLQ